jgi:hypothetical protein
MNMCSPPPAAAAPALLAVIPDVGVFDLAGSFFGGIILLDLIYRGFVVFQLKLIKVQSLWIINEQKMLLFIKSGVIKLPQSKIKALLNANTLVSHKH